jgi:ribosomal protein S12 methylthiotransferase
MKQVGENIKNERYEEIIRSQSEIVDEFNKKIIGKRFKVLFDTPFTARSYMDAPDIDGRFEIVKGKHKTGEFGNIKVLEAKGYVRRGISV